MKQFDLTYKKRTFVRWNNWKDFVESIDELNYNFELNNANGGVALFFLTYNLSDSVIKLLSKLNEEKDRNSFDIIVVDNHSKDEEYLTVKDFIDKQNIGNVILIRTTDNLGGAGGNAIAMEYILSKEYKYIIFTEDDAFPEKDNLVSNMIQKKTENYIIRTYWVEGGCIGNPFHFTLYPDKFIELVGVPNPSLFMRADDEDFYFRMNKIVHDTKYKYSPMQDGFLHPMIKKGAGKYRGTYFSIRNAFMTKTRYFTGVNITFAIKDVIKEFIILFFYIRTGFSKLLIEYNYKLLVTVFVALWDYLFGNINYENNKRKLKYLGKWNNDTKLNVNYKWENFMNLDKLTQNKFLLDPCLKNIKTHNLPFSKNLRNYFRFGCILYTFNLPLYPCIFLSPKAISVEEYNIGNNEAYIGILEGHRTIKNIVSIVISLLLATIFFVPLFIITFIKIILFKIIRLLGK